MLLAEWCERARLHSCNKNFQNSKRTFSSRRGGTEGNMTFSLQLQIMVLVVQDFIRWKLGHESNGSFYMNNWKKSNPIEL